MRGLNPQEVCELMEYIKENNSWSKMYSLHKQGRVTPKYITMQFDTRTGDMWYIAFRGCIGGKNSSKEEVVFRTERDYNLKDEIYKWLNDTK